MSRTPTILVVALVLVGCRLPDRGGYQDDPVADSGADSGADTASGCRTVVEEQDEGLDGVVDRRVTEVYDTGDNLLSAATDSGADGTTETRVTLLYDGEGRRLSYELDDDGDGALDYRATYTYSALGDLLEVVADVGPDGVADSVTTSTWDADHHILTEDTTYPTDPEADPLSWAWTWDSRGNLSTVTLRSGEAQSRAIYGYDPDDHEIRMEMWQEDVLEWVRTSTWTGDLLVTEDVDFDGDGSVEASTTLSYDANGWLTLLQQVDPADGSVNIAMGYTYDERGNQLSEEVTTDTWELRTSTWDAGDNLLSKLYTYQDEDRSPFVFRYVYTDGC